MKKRILSFLLALALVAAVFAIPTSKSEAASVSTIRAKKAVYYGENGKKNTACEYECKFVGRYNKFVVDVYDASGKRVTGTSRSYIGKDGYSDTIIYTLTPTGYKTGTTFVIKAKLLYGDNYQYSTDEITTTFVIGSNSGTHRNEWYNGQWYDANGNNSYGGVLVWQSDAYGWWVEDTKGWMPRNEWVKIDGYWYFFTASGYMDYSEYRGGCWLGADGKCSSTYVNGTWHSDAYGWWYTDGNWYPTSQWLWIDGVCYWFDGSGYTY